MKEVDCSERLLLTWNCVEKYKMTIKCYITLILLPRMIDGIRVFYLMLQCGGQLKCCGSPIVWIYQLMRRSTLETSCHVHE